MLIGRWLFVIISFIIALIFNRISINSYISSWEHITLQTFQQRKALSFPEIMQQLGDDFAENGQRISD